MTGGGTEPKRQTDTSGERIVDETKQPAVTSPIMSGPLAAVAIDGIVSAVGLKKCSESQHDARTDAQCDGGDGGDGAVETRFASLKNISSE